MTGYQKFQNFQNSCNGTTDGSAAAAASACANRLAIGMDAVLCAASIFVILILTSLLGLAFLSVSICVLVLVCLIRLICCAACLERAKPVT